MSGNFSSENPEGNRGLCGGLLLFSASIRLQSRKIIVVHFRLASWAVGV